MTSVICKSLFSRGGRSSRILVTAPTNKAITVLCSRFLKSLGGFNDLNIVLIGVEDKLVVTEDSDNGMDNVDDINSNCLKDIFVYTWVEKIVLRYKTIERILLKYKNKNELYSITKEAKLLRDKLKNSIPLQSKKSGVLSLAQNLVSILHSCSMNRKRDNDDTSVDSCNNRSSYASTVSQAMSIVSKLISSLQQVAGSDVVDELLYSANVIFCTLSSSGVAAMKRTRHVDGKCRSSE